VVDPALIDVILFLYSSYIVLQLSVLFESKILTDIILRMFLILIRFGAIYILLKITQYLASIISPYNLQHILLVVLEIIKFGTLF